MAAPSPDPSAPASGSSSLLAASNQLWRATTPPNREPAALATGHAVLDGHLHGNGWPAAGLTEVLHGAAGIGELRLLLPALARLSQSEEKWVAWVNPPHMPSGPALAAAGVDTARVLVIHPRDHKETLWCLEQAMKSGTCSAVLGWPDARQLKPAEVRRLQLAASQGGTSAFLFRPEQAAATASPAQLRLHLRPGAVRVLKRRGGWATDWLALEPAEGPATGSNHRLPACRLQDQLALWRHQPARVTNSGPLLGKQRQPQPPTLAGQLAAWRAERLADWPADQPAVH